MKIAMIGHKRIPSREGGVEVVVEELATRMVKKGHDITCYNRSGEHVAGREYSKEQNKEYKGIKLKKVFTINKKGLAAMTSSLFATIKALFSKANVVHYHAEGPCAMMWLIKWFSNKKIIATIHGLDWQRAKWSGFATKYIKFGEKMAAKYADEIIVLSENVKKYFKDTYNRDTVFIPNGVNKPEIKNAKIITKKHNLKKDDYILYLGRIVPEKGIHYLIEAFSKIKTNKKLVIAGGTSDTDSYYNEIKELAKKDDRIILTGFVQGEELQELFSNAYIYCLPSDLEGMPLSLLEAMSYGNCCLTSDIDECSEVLEDKGVTFEKSNVKDLENKLNDLIKNKEKVKKYKENAQEFILNKYNWDDVNDKTLELYEKKMERKKNDKKTIFPLAIMICLLIAEIFTPKLSFLKYCEEIVSLIMLIYISIYIFVKKNKISDTIKIIILCCIFLMIIGIISNFYSKLQCNWVPIILDILANFKLVVICVGFYLYLEEKSINKIIHFFEPISKIFIILGLIFGIVSIFFDLGMRGQLRYGFYSFNFIFKYAHIYAMMLLFSLLILSYSMRNEKKIYKYIFCVIIQLILSLKGISIVTAVAMILFVLYFKKYKKINVYIILLLGICCLFFGKYQIKIYLLNNDAPRSLFYIHGFETGRKYFPLGSGFATFGSDMAIDYYSKLYYEYGFDKLHGMNPKSPSFLKDNYWPMIMGQFGFIGLIISFIIVYRMFKILNNLNIENIPKSILFSSAFYIILASVGTSIFVASATVVLCVGMIIVVKKSIVNKVENDNYINNN